MVITTMWCVARPPTAMHRKVGPKGSELVAYQNTKYAERYAQFVERVRAAETANVPGSTELTESVARYLHKLMAYKDEYEEWRDLACPRTAPADQRAVRVGALGDRAGSQDGPILRSIAGIVAPPSGPALPFRWQQTDSGWQLPPLADSGARCPRAGRPQVRRTPSPRPAPRCW
jgi:hypothetical protein